MQSEKSGGKKCFKHGDSMRYYCINCDEAACSDGVAIYGLVTKIILAQVHYIL